MVLFDLYWKYHNFERNEIRATVFLKWTDFSLGQEKLGPFEYLIWTNLYQKINLIQTLSDSILFQPIWFDFNQIIRVGYL